jgi:hypothetical protein
MHGPLNFKAEMSGGICVSVAISPKTCTGCTFSYKRPPLTSDDQYMRHHSKQLEIRMYWQIVQRRSQWPRGLRRRSAAALLLRLWARIPSGSRMFVCCECCVLSGSDDLITRPEESYRQWCVIVCGLGRQKKL